MSVKDLMTENPLTVTPADSLATAAERMWQGDCGVLPVVNEEGVVRAMITDRDICMASWSRSRPPAELRVEEAMSRSLVVCRPTDAVESAEGAMRSSQVRRLPVVDEGNRLLGIISLADIALANDHTQRAHRSASVNGLSTTLAVICAKPPQAVPSNRAAPSSEATVSDEPTAAKAGQEAKDGEAA